MEILTTVITQYKKKYRGGDEMTNLMKAEQEVDNLKDNDVVSREVIVKKYHKDRGTRADFIINSIPELEYLSGKSREQVKNTILLTMGE